MKNLPQTMPVFPLESAVMFPNTYLPLNIFEPRYLKMIDYSMSHKNRLIGMIQPKKSIDKNKNVDLYNVGCAGRIIKFEETEDSRYLITLKGVSRFNLLSDITNKDNFREAKVNWNEFIEDLNQEGSKDSFVSLKKVLKEFFKLKKMKVNMEIIEACNDYNFVDQITMICPLALEEKQLLLETKSITKRNNLLKSIIESYSSQQNISNTIKH
ncbi:LON peptidase substrate-binding domain-containing protein [Alphaproteobacteria bacterium]|nr:LON peptidase substrate-binding domain-containing protein [Alphaproteobacteria bacterium]